MQLSIIVSTLLSLAIAAPLNKRDVVIPDYIQKFKGTTYTPFDENDNCRTPDQIKTDLSYLKDFSLLRLYSNDCNVIQYAAETINGKLLVAVNDISSLEGITNDLYNIAAAIGNAGKEFNDVVDTVIVGNELIYNGWYPASAVQGFVAQAKSVFPYFPGKWITGETISSYYGNPELCEFNDYIGVNSHPYFDDSTAEDAGDYVLGHIQAVAQFCSEHGHDKNALTIETGWPWKGDQNKASIPSPENQVIALKAISEKAGGDSIAYSAYNELWKADGNLHVEKNWGFLGNAPSAW